MSTTPINFLRSTGKYFNLPTPKSSTFAYKLFKLVETLVSLLKPTLSTSTFKAIKSFLAAKSDVSMPFACSKFYLVA